MLIPKMTPYELEATVSIIDAAIDRSRKSHDRSGVRVFAGLFLFYISSQPDGPKLMAAEMSRLSELCSDPLLLYGSVFMFGSAAMQTTYPELRGPRMLEAIKQPDANSPDGRGPAYATILFLHPRDPDLTQEVLTYMRRPDLTGQKLLDFLTGIRATSSMPDNIVEQLVYFLNDPDPAIRLAALADISIGGIAERGRLRPILQRLIDDPTQSQAFRSLAVQVLRTDGPVMDAID